MNDQKQIKEERNLFIKNIYLNSAATELLFPLTDCLKSAVHHYSVVFKSLN
jgi:hypothetical protein